MPRLPHTHLQPDSLPPDVVVCGDPARADFIASLLDTAEKVADKREYRTHRGSYRGRQMAVCSHGIGAPGAAIAFEELIAAGARRLVRVGTCGSLQDTVNTGDMVVATAAVQWTGYGREITPSGFPAVADLNLTHALTQTPADGNVHTGLVLTRDAFYAGLDSGHIPDYRALADGGVLVVEMECAALFLIGQLRQVATGALLAVDGNVFEHGEQMDSFDPTTAEVATAVDRAARLALDTLAATAT